MKKLLLFVTALAILSPALRAQEDKPASKKNSPKIISALEATNHVDESVIVTGKIAQVTIREKMVYLNMDKPFPGSPLTAVVFATKTNEFGDLQKLRGESVELNGKIQLFRERPEIVLSSTNQLKVVEKTKDSGDAEKK